MPPKTDPAPARPLPVWWVVPATDRFQHATLARPPHNGGPVPTLGGEHVDVPAFVDVPRAEFRSFCPSCLRVCLDGPATVWLWTY